MPLCLDNQQDPELRGSKSQPLNISDHTIIITREALTGEASTRATDRGWDAGMEYQLMQAASAFHSTPLLRVFLNL